MIKLENVFTATQDVVAQLHLLIEYLLEFTKQTSFNDFVCRKNFLKRTCYVFEIYASVLNDLFATANESSACMSALISAVECLLCFDTALSWYAPFELNSFKDMKSRVNTEAHQSGKRNVLFTLNRELDRPVVECRKAVPFLLNQVRHSGILFPSFVEYAVSIEWLTLLWSFNTLIPRENVFYSSSKLCLSREHFLQLESVKHAIRLAENLSQVLDTCNEEIRLSDKESRVHRQLDALRDETENIRQRLAKKSELAASYEDQLSDLGQKLAELDFSNQSSNQARVITFSIMLI